MPFCDTFLALWLNPYFTIKSKFGSVCLWALGYYLKVVQGLWLMNSLSAIMKFYFVFDLFLSSWVYLPVSLRTYAFNFSVTRILLSFVTHESRAATISAKRSFIALFSFWSHSSCYLFSSLAVAEAIWAFRLSIYFTVSDLPFLSFFESIWGWISAIFFLVSSSNCF